LIISMTFCTPVRDSLAILKSSFLFKLDGPRARGPVRPRPRGAAG
jgi:hypothetical protein